MKVKIGRKKNRDLNNIIDVLESLFVEYDPLILQLLWAKDIFSNSASKKNY
jgi:hypothetical protein